MNKFVLIFLYALVLTFSLQFFFPSQKAVNTSPNILLTVADDSLVIPNIPKIEIINTTASGIVIQPCKDLKLNINSRTLTDLEKFAPNFCLDKEILSGETKIIPLEEFAKVFASNPGKYIFTLNTPLGERVVSFELQEPGTFRSLLTMIIYDPIYNLFVALLTFLPGHML